jgi:hypothetical protein
VVISLAGGLLEHAIRPTIRDRVRIVDRVRMRTSNPEECIELLSCTQTQEAFAGLRQVAGSALVLRLSRDDDGLVAICRRTQSRQR